jgi:23S rRNA pseudouridine2605 synthase
MAHAGAASRRESEKLITEGRVCVNGVVVTKLGLTVEENDLVSLDGKLLKPEEIMHYIAMNKPPLYLCSSSDPQNRPLARDLLPRDITERLYNVGRLDFLSSGLIFFTNDGTFTAKLSHPSSEIEKEYLVEATNEIPESLLAAFQEGLNIEGVFYQCRAIEKTGRKSLRIVLIEGKNREIRKVFSHFHLHPKVLRRIRIGALSLGDLREGKTRELTEKEISSFVK